MGTTYRFIENPTESSSVLQWFRALPVPPEEMQTQRATVLFFRSFGALAFATIYLPRTVRGALWSVGEVHFLSTPLKERFPELHKINNAFAKWLRQFEIVFSNKSGGVSEWNYYLEGSVTHYDPPVFGLPSGLQAIQNNQYFIADDDNETVIEKVCSSLRLRGVHCESLA
jgi:hypothetical protein